MAQRRTNNSYLSYRCSTCGDERVFDDRCGFVSNQESSSYNGYEDQSRYGDFSGLGREPFTMNRPHTSDNSRTGSNDIDLQRYRLETSRPIDGHMGLGDEDWRETAIRQMEEDEARFLLHQVLQGYIYTSELSRSVIVRNVAAATGINLANHAPHEIRDILAHWGRMLYERSYQRSREEHGRRRPR